MLNVGIQASSFFSNLNPLFASHSEEKPNEDLKHIGDYHLNGCTSFYLFMKDSTKDPDD